MQHRMKRTALAVVLSFSLPLAFMTPSFSATATAHPSSPAKKIATSRTTVTAKPKPKAKPKKAVPKKVATKKVPAKKVSSKKTPTKKTPTKKAVKKSTPVKRTKVRRPMPVRASPSPAWPPANFSVIDGIYFKVPTSKELVGIISAHSTLANQVARCSASACGAILVASVTSCKWWEIDSTVYGPSSTDATKSVVYGTLRTTAPGSRAKLINTILLVSSEPLANGVTVGGIAAKCWTTSPTVRVPSNQYAAVSAR